MSTFLSTFADEAIARSINDDVVSDDDTGHKARIFYILVRGT